MLLWKVYKVFQLCHFAHDFISISFSINKKKKNPVIYLRVAENFFVLQQQRFEVLKCYIRFGSYLFFNIQPLSTTLKLIKHIWKT